uniref:Uncharacterized protein LOC105142279 n=1 Tax=Rhizophora mucronata TaxID=61149 RepID=A0A2P2J746_RHIMU
MEALILRRNLITHKVKVTFSLGLSVLWRHWGQNMPFSMFHNLFDQFNILLIMN